jgi:hypothetical protein
MPHHSKRWFYKRRALAIIKGGEIGAGNNSMILKKELKKLMAQLRSAKI